MSTGVVIVALFLLVLIGIVVYDYFRTRYPIKGIIAGDISRKQIRLKDKFLYSLNGYTIQGELGKAEDFCLVGYVKGNSLTPFGLPGGMKVFCEKVMPDDIKKDDVLIIETLEGPNKGKPKGRKCIGRWGKPDQPDDNLKQIENHCNSVEEYFAEVAPKRYGYDKPYDGKIEGYLKTLSCDRDVEKLKISRPHDPKSVIARVAYAL